MSQRKRLYSLFEKIDGKWVRQSETALYKDQAVRVFQTRLLDGSMNGKCMALRPVK